MKTKTRKSYLPALALALAGAAPNLSAQTVAWGGSASENVLSFDSKGNQDVNMHIWELGWFSDGYTPTAHSHQPKA